MVRFGTTFVALMALVVWGTNADAGIFDISTATAVLATGDVEVPAVQLVDHRGRGGYKGYGRGGHGHGHAGYHRQAYRGYGGYGYGGYGYGGHGYGGLGYGVPVYRPNYGYGGGYGYGVPSCGYGGYTRGLRGGIYIGF
jgi:hypothetical protein